VFDNRTYFFDSSLNITWMPTARTSYTFGGSGDRVIRRSQALANLNSYNLTGNINHVLTRTQSIGISFIHSHYDYPNFFGESDINTFEGTYGASVSREWTFNARAGIFVSESTGLQSFALDPALAALLGIKSILAPATTKTTNASGLAELRRQFRRASFFMRYSRAANPGNGVYLTSRLDTAATGLSYTGVRKLNLGVDGSYYRLTSLGTNLQHDQQFSAGAGLSYELFPAVHLTGRYDVRHEEIDLGGYKRSGYRVAFGVAFSPGNIPLSLW
jgi:hypothetical protein